MLRSTEIYVPKSVCLYEKAASAFIAEVEGLLRRVRTKPKQTIGRVIIVQDYSKYDWTSSWIEEIQSENLLAELAARVLRLRLVFREIRSSTLPWIYVSDSDCLGSFFELAMACHHRFWFSSALVGFPELANHILPPAGGLELTQSKSSKIKSHWYASPTKSTQEATAVGLIQYLGTTGDWKNWFDHLPLGSFKNSSKKDDHGLDTPSFSNDEGRDFLNIKYSEYYRAHDPKDRLELVWGILKSKSRLKNRGDTDKLLSYLGAQNLLTDSYLNWLRHQTPRPLSQSSIAHSQFLQIDLSANLPPTDIVKSSLENGRKIIFIGKDHNGLAISLNTIFSRLSRELGNTKTEALWKCQVSWFTGKKIDKYPLLTFALDDMLELNVADKEYQLYNLNGNKSSSKKGVMELASEKFPNLNSLKEKFCFNDITTQVIHSNPRSKNHPPVSEIIRSIVLQEILYLSTRVDGGLEALLKGLSELKWGFLASQERWTRFLTIRHSMKLTQNLGETHLGYIFDRNILELAAWKQIKELKLTHSNDIELNLMECDVHLTILAGILSTVLCEERTIDKLAEAEKLVVACFGFPEYRGSPLQYVVRRGAKRSHYYAKKYWPNLEKYISEPN